jgi:hypothetical protein
MREEKASEVARRLADSDETQLLEELGLRQQAIEKDPAKANDPDPELPREVRTMGAKEALQAIGRRVLHRWNREAHKLVCGKDAKDAASRDELRRALGMGDAAAAAALTPLLLLIPGLPLALAPVLAALIIRTFAAPALDELCGYWGEQLASEKAP